MNFIDFRDSRSSMFEFFDVKFFIVYIFFFSMISGTVIVFFIRDLVRFYFGSSSLLGMLLVF